MMRKAVVASERIQRRMMLMKEEPEGARLRVTSKTCTGNAKPFSTTNHRAALLQPSHLVPSHF
jgi:hypothetical protein